VPVHLVDPAEGSAGPVKRRGRALPLLRRRPRPTVKSAGGPGERSRPHHAVTIEARAHAILERRLRRRGWVPIVVPFVGYGHDGWVRILARVHVVPPGGRGIREDEARGWRQFVSPSLAGVRVTVELGEETQVVTSMRKGYIDVRLRADLAPGWTTARLAVGDGDAVDAPVRIVGPDSRLGVISDVDDTVIVTMLPRPIVALRNALIARSVQRRPVPGMVQLYREIVGTQPDVFMVYLSTGSWQTATTLRSFLERHDYPPGPLLLSHWGPTDEGWFRSGQRHKRDQIRRLFSELPQLRWLLVGDDSQHDPSLYAEMAASDPGKVLGIAIRQLSVAEHAMGHGSAGPVDLPAPGARLAGNPVCAPDGFGLREGLRARRIVLPADQD
jgi:phosphatidate phosphatase APP1